MKANAGGREPRSGRRWEHLRVRHPARQRRLRTLAAAGQQTPIVVVTVADQPDRYLVIDGYQRIAALQQLGRDTLEAVVWPRGEAEALLLDRSRRLSEHETALEQGWLLAEMEQRFGYAREGLARRFDRSVSWVARRWALVELLPEAIQPQVRKGPISAHVAMQFLERQGLEMDGCHKRRGRHGDLGNRYDDGGNERCDTGEERKPIAKALVGHRCNPPHCSGLPRRKSGPRWIEPSPR